MREDAAHRVNHDLLRSRGSGALKANFGSESAALEAKTQAIYANVSWLKMKEL